MTTHVILCIESLAAGAIDQ